jgi:hypothetical protein
MSATDVARWQFADVALMSDVYTMRNGIVTQARPSNSG